jgi:hypothetical protein
MHRKRKKSKGLACSEIQPEVEEHIADIKKAEATGWCSFDDADYSPVDFEESCVVRLSTAQMTSRSCDSCCTGPPDSYGQPQTTILGQDLQLVGVEVRAAPAWEFPPAS